MTHEKLTFTSESGDELAGRLDIPDDDEPRGYVLFAHCFTGSKDVLAAVRIAKALWLRGFAVFRFDFPGLGESEGDFANTTFSSNVGDLVAAASFLRDSPEARAVCTIGAPADPEHVVHHFADAREEIEAAGEAEVTIGGRPFRIKSSFLEDIEGHSLKESIRDMRKALLVFHSPVDEIVDIGNARRIYEAARHPKSFLCLDGADHMLTNRADAYYVAEVISAWANRYNEETA